MIIAVDAMGGENAPQAMIEGARLALKEFSDIEKIILVGDKKRIDKIIKNEDNIYVEDCVEIIENNDAPGSAYRKKKDASIVVATRLVAEGKADAIVSAGSTGAQTVAALFELGRIEGVERPGVATLIPTLNKEKLLLDSGANPNCKVEHLVQYALMGSIYAEKILGINSPKVALISNGTEDQKGSDVVVKTNQRLRNMNNINFIGNIEGRDIPVGKTDVMVCDGFLGNVILKTIEGLASSFIYLLQDKMKKNLLANLGGKLLFNSIKDTLKQIDYAEYGGAPLLGINGISIVCHGNSSAKAIKNALKTARDCYAKELNKVIAENLLVNKMNGDNSNE